MVKIDKSKKKAYIHKHVDYDENGDDNLNCAFVPCCNMRVCTLAEKIDAFEPKPLLTFSIKNYIVGSSPTTKWTKIIGTNTIYDQGKAIILETIDNRWIYIGDSVIELYPLYPIKELVAEVLNNDVVYSYFIDTKNNIYSLDEYHPISIINSFYGKKVDPDTFDFNQYIYSDDAPKGKKYKTKIIIKRL